MKVSLEKQGKNLVQLGLELEPDKALKAYEVTCRQLSHKVNIPGFRKGKAPRNILEKTLGVDYIKREALEHLVPQLLNKAILDENLDVITEPEIDSYNFELGQPLILSATFEVRPEVTLGQYQGVKVSVPEAMLPPDALDRALTSVAESKASLQPVAGRPIVMGDTVVLDFECYVANKLVEGGKAESLILEMKEGNFLEGFCEQLVGRQPDNTCEVKVRFPDHYRNTELAGKDALFKVALKGIRQRVVPDKTDELARLVGQESLDTLQDLLRKQLEMEVHGENESRAQKAVVEAVIANAQVDIPDTMVDRERELLMRQVQTVIEQNGQDWATFQQDANFTEISNSKHDEARHRVLTSLVLGAVVRAEKMAVSPEEMVPLLSELASRHCVSIEKLVRDMEVRRQVMEEILTQKVVRFLVEHADVSFTPDTTESTEQGL
ncbi:MAG: trigger factor [Candidatus Melainabacteria bacterium]|nr:trigger factor [Candidatus Melainabacteria bacterium]